MAKMRISPELKKLIEKYRCVKDTEGMSPAKVYKLVGENENLYLKMTDSRYKGTTYDVEREKDMMLWLEGKLPVPKVLHFERHDGWSNLLMSEADGVLCSEEYAVSTVSLLWEWESRSLIHKFLKPCMI